MIPNSIKFILIANVLFLLLAFFEIINPWWFIPFLLISTFIYAIWASAEGEKKLRMKKRSLHKDLCYLPGFVYSKKFISPNGFIAIDDSNKQIAIKEKSGRIRKFPYSSILSCEILEDGVTTYKKTSTVGRAIVGGVLAGGAGAIVGGLSGKNVKNKEVISLDLRIVIKDTYRPSFTISFFDAYEETHQTKKAIKISDAAYGSRYYKALEDIRIWKNTLEVIIDNQKVRNSATNYSISDELLKLNQLKSEGIITEAEFLKQKQKLLD